MSFLRNKKIAGAALVPSQEAPQLVEKIFTDQFGRQFRMVFLVTVIDGELKGRLVSAEQLSANSPRLQGTTSEASEILSLPIFEMQKEVVTEYVPAFTPVVSPYTELFFFTSQPTRAPSRI